MQEARSRGASLAIENEQLKKDRANARRMMEKRMAAAKFRKGGSKNSSVRSGGKGGRKKVFNEQSRRASFIPENVNELVSGAAAAASQTKKNVNSGMKALRERARRMKKGGKGEGYSKLK